MSSTAQQLRLLHLIAPRTEHKGLIANNPWLPDACSRAACLFEDRSLNAPAVVLAAAHEAAVDYLVQAPVLVVAIASRADFALKEQRQRVAAQFKVACSVRPRLRDLMRHYGLAPQLRVISADALSRSHSRLLKLLSDVPPSRLAQCIPDDVDEQIEWLSAVERWRGLVQRVMPDADWLLSWAAASRCHRHAHVGATELIDFASRNRATFDTDWTFTQAIAASTRWHEAFAHQSLEATCTAEELSALANYGALPAEAVVDDYTFVALRTRVQLFDEGRAMHHCVSSYADRVFAGWCWIYSIRQHDQRVATLELRHNANGFAAAQLRSHCNRPPPAAAVEAAVRFVVQINATIEIAPVLTPLAASVHGQAARGRRLRRV